MKTFILIVPILLLAISCNEKVEFNLEEETEKILNLHHAQRDYHFGKDSISFANQLSDNFISVNRGKITRPDRQSTISRYHNYFSSVEFIKWDDVSEPVVRFSEDGSLAYTIVEKVVKVSYEDENGMMVDSETLFAWTAIYKKYLDEWKIDCVTSTNTESI